MKEDERRGICLHHNPAYMCPMFHTGASKSSGAFRGSYEWSGGGATCFSGDKARLDRRISSFSLSSLAAHLPLSLCACARSLRLTGSLSMVLDHHQRLALYVGSIWPR